MKCPQCHNDFPEELISEGVFGGQSVRSCPLCALLIRNVYHRLPIETPFSGTLGSEYVGAGE